MKMDFSTGMGYLKNQNQHNKVKYSYDGEPRIPVRCLNSPQITFEFGKYGNDDVTV